MLQQASSPLRGQLGKTRKTGGFAVPCHGPTFLNTSREGLRSWQFFYYLLSVRFGVAFHRARARGAPHLAEVVTDILRGVRHALVRLAEPGALD